MIWSTFFTFSKEYIKNINKWQIDHFESKNSTFFSLYFLKTSSENHSVIYKTSHVSFNFVRGISRFTIDTVQTFICY